MISKDMQSVYDALPQSVVDGSREEDGNEGLHLSPRRRSSSLTFVLLFTNIVTLVSLTILGWKLLHPESLENSGRRVSTTSPALEALRYLPPRYYNGTFLQTNKYRAPPGEYSEDVDKAWEQIEVGAGGIWVTEEELNKIGKTSTEDHPAHKVPQEHGNGYIAMLEVFHLLHCLNALRMALWFNHEHYKHIEEGVPLKFKQSHYDHCIDMLRENLMCNADVTPAIFYDVLDNPRKRDPIADWSTLHTCRDFDAILDWNKNGPRAMKWRNAGTNPFYDPNLPGADKEYGPEGTEVDD